MTWRYEIKFALPAEDELRFLDWLGSAEYFHRAFPTRQVNSIYLDSSDFDCATTNLDGIGWRSKYRCRWYGERFQAGAKTFEAKVKRGRLGRKYSEPIVFDLDRFSTLDHDILARAVTELEVLSFAPAIAINLDPTLYVGYEREYFVGPHGIRLTLDRDLTFLDLTNKDHLGHDRTEEDDRLILEFKFPPEVKDQVAEIMTGVPFPASRSSKYVLGLAKVGRAIYF